jgi:glycosyltransferase involved in cell wall biosynthesis
MPVRIVFFSSQFFNVINYLLVLEQLKLKHEFVWAPLIPRAKQREFYHRLALVPHLTNTRIQPIFLDSPDFRFAHLLNPRIVLQDFRTILTQLWQMRPDAILVTYLLNAYPLIILKHLLRCTVSVMATGTDINLHKAWIDVGIRRLIYASSHAIFAVSEELKQQIDAESGQHAILLPTGIDPSFWQPRPRSPLREKWGFKVDDIVMLTVSNLETHKGVDVAIRALDLVHKRGWQQVQLAIVGDGTEKQELHRLSQQLGIAQNIKLLGLHDKERLRELYSLADCFSLSSYTEGLPFALLEAMACETACIVSPVGDIPKVIHDGVNGFLPSAVTPTAFADTIEQTLQLTPAHLNTVRKEARRRVVRHYNLLQITTKMIEHTTSS